MGTVETSIGLHGLRDHRLDGAGAGDIDLDKGGFPTVFRDHMDGLLPTVCVHIRNDEFRPFPCKR
jgi:hypothetical protein